MQIFETYSDTEHRALDGSAICALFLTLQLSFMNASERDVNFLNSSGLIRVTSLCIAVVAIAGSLFLFFRMVNHCIFVSEMYGLLKFVWLIVFFSLLWVGAMIYYFAVYRRLTRNSSPP